MLSPKRLPAPPLHLHGRNPFSLSLSLWLARSESRRRNSVPRKRRKRTPLLLGWRRTNPDLCLSMSVWIGAILRSVLYLRTEGQIRRRVFLAQAGRTRCVLGNSSSASRISGVGEREELSFLGKRQPISSLGHQ